MNNPEVQFLRVGRRRIAISRIRYADLVEEENGSRIVLLRLDNEITVPVLAPEDVDIVWRWVENRTIG